MLKLSILLFSFLILNPRSFAITGLVTDVADTKVSPTIASYPLYNLKIGGKLELSEDGMLDVVSPSGMRITIRANMKRLFYHHTPNYSGYFLVDHNNQIYRLTYEINAAEYDLVISSRFLKTASHEHRLFLNGPITNLVDQSELSLTTENGRKHKLGTVLKENGWAQEVVEVLRPPGWAIAKTTYVESSYPLFLGPNSFGVLYLTNEGQLRADINGFMYVSSGAASAGTISGSTNVSVLLGSNIERLLYYSSPSFQGYIALSKIDGQIYRLKTNSMTMLDERERHLAISLEPLALKISKTESLNYYLSQWISPASDPAKLMVFDDDGNRMTLEAALDRCDSLLASKGGWHIRID